MNKRFGILIFLCVLLLSLNGCDKKDTSSQEAEDTSDTTTELKQSTLSTTQAPPIIAKNSEKIAKIVETRIKTLGENPNIGISIVNLKTHETLYTLNGDRSFIPASVMKVITSTNAIYYLGPQYHFYTAIAADNTSNNGTLNGNVYLRFSGDPSLTQVELDQLLQHLIQQHTNTITGNIIIDLSYYPQRQDNPGFMSDDQNFGYAAFTDAIIIDRNQFNFYLFPSKNLPGTATITSESSLKFTPIDVQVDTKLRAKDDCPLALYPDEMNHYQLQGCIPYSASPYHFSVGVHNPTKLLVDQLHEWLAAQHIELKGSILVGKMPSSAHILASNKSPSLAEITRYLLKTSDNVYANAVFKTVGALYQNDDASWENGEKTSIDLLKKLGIDTKGIVIVDGAGLSRYNLLTPNVLQNVIIYNYDHPAVGQYVFQGLSVSGKDGSLHRYKMGKYTGSFSAKSGTMQQIATIAGVLKTKKGPPLGIVVMVNGSQRSRTYFYFIHDIVMDIAKQQF